MYELGYVGSMIPNGLSHRRDVVLARDGKEVKGAYQKNDNQEPTVSKDKEKKWGRNCKALLPPPAQEVDISFLVVGVSCSPLTGINTNDSSVGPSISMSSMRMQPLEMILWHETQTIT
jgi:hypothetical protein